MNQKKSIIGIFVSGLILNTVFIYGQVYYFVDDFESHEPGQQLACQDSLDWTTFLGNPCDPVEDPVISTNYRLTGTKAVKIVQNNDLVKPFGAHTDDYLYISFWTFIPEGKSGYFNTLAVFNPPTNYDWAMECYFDVGGSGRLINVPGQTITFTYPVGFWFKVTLLVDLFSTPSQATLKINDTMVLIWDWTQGGAVTDQLAATDFFGALATDEMYIDNFAFVPLPLTIPPLLAPTNLTAVEIFNPYPQVQLNWQDNSNYEYAFNILRKHGPLFGAGLFEPIGTAPVNATVYIDSTVVVDSTYTYSVVAYNEFEFSDTISFATIMLHPVNVTPVNQVVNSFSLWQNYPNPFNPSTKIKFTIPQSPLLGGDGRGGLVTLKVYDVLGNEITTLVNEELPAGEYEVEFDASGLTSGIYFYKLKVGDLSDTKKLILLK